MSLYNLSFLDTANNSLDIAKGVNEASGSWLYGAMLIALFCLIFIIGAFKYDIEDVFIADGLLTAVVGGFMWSAGLLPGWVIIYPTIFLFIGVVYKIWGKST